MISSRDSQGQTGNIGVPPIVDEFEYDPEDDTQAPCLDRHQFTADIKKRVGVDVVKSGPAYNNFPKFFKGEFDGHLDHSELRELDEVRVYAKFAIDHPELNTELRGLMKRAVKISRHSDMDIDIIDAIRIADEVLYRAYIVMKGYGISDKVLFS